MTKTAVIVVDLQKDYLTSGRFALEGIDQAIANAGTVIAAARAAGVAVFNIRHENPVGAPFFEPETDGARIIPAVAPADDETVITKNFPNSFRETGLNEALDAEGITDVVIVGAMSHMCIDATARAAADHGYAVTVVADACATRDAEFDGRVVPAADVHASFMSALAFAYAEVKKTADVRFG
ncbi:cysteine hydrolase family protein [Paracoccus laeviglucosivorans]|uniref:Nicotinamidase-related amidase n=1 Tax=Paracoccus laeviglucosivorans TaxID=1197861 RepID=A0A521FNM7_9RHOB|nr:cysteine hydrolase family protein [Paracoccus laeviglucosivorans]SMO97744.1 Nicotinamidase-related amidase [Paracoccus laeviglucosivorans]